jgi:hypothetical protein
VLEERPGNAVDLLETSLLIKKTAAEVSKPKSGLQGKVISIFTVQQFRLVRFSARRC